MTGRCLVPLILLGLLAPACQSGTIESGPDLVSGDIVIASDMPVSDFGSQVRTSQQAIQFAISQNANIDGFKLDYMPLDDALGAVPFAEKGVQNVERMIQDNRVMGMVVSGPSVLSADEIPVANKAGLVLLSPSNTNICLTEAAPFCRPQPMALRPIGINNYFRIAAPDDLEGTAMARFAARSLKVTRAAAFNMWPDGGDLIIKNFANELAHEGGQLVFSQPLPQDTTDFSKFLKAASASGVQAVYAITDGSSDVVCTARGQMTPALFPNRTYFLATDGILGDDQCVKQVAGNTADIYYTFSDVDPTHSSVEAVKQTVAAYRKLYSKPSDISIYTFAAYDCAGILIEAIKRAIKDNGGKYPTRAEVLKAVEDTRYVGVTGTYSFDANGDAISPLMSLSTIENGQWTYLEPADASATPR